MVALNAKAERGVGANAAATEAAREALRLWGDAAPGYFASQQRIAAELSCSDECAASR